MCFFLALTSTYLTISLLNSASKLINFHGFMQDCDYDAVLGLDFIIIGGSRRVVCLG